MAYLSEIKPETTSPNSLGELKKIPLRRRNTHSLECVRRTGELQERFDFGKQQGKKAQAESQWAEIIAGDPMRYCSPLMQHAAALALHRAGKAHAFDRCLLCQKGTAA